MIAKLALFGADNVRNRAGATFNPMGIEVKADSQGRVLVYLEPIRNCFAFDRLIGSAKISVHDGVVWADCDFLEHKLPLSLLDILYPHPVGSVLKSEGDHIKNMVIEAVSISIDKPLDARIPSLKAQGVRTHQKG